MAEPRSAMKTSRDHGRHDSQSTEGDRRSIRKQGELSPTFTRERLSSVPESRLKALWCALDADDSNELHKDEMAGFSFQRMFLKPFEVGGVGRVGVGEGGGYGGWMVLQGTMSQNKEFVGIISMADIRKGLISNDFDIDNIHPS